MKGVFLKIVPLLFLFSCFATSPGLAADQWAEQKLSPAQAEQWAAQKLLPPQAVQSTTQEVSLVKAGATQSMARESYKKNEDDEVVKGKGRGIAPFIVLFIVIFVGNLVKGAYKAYKEYLQIKCLRKYARTDSKHTEDHKKISKFLAS